MFDKKTKKNSKSSGRKNTGKRKSVDKRGPGSSDYGAEFYRSSQYKYKYDFEDPLYREYRRSGYGSTGYESDRSSSNYGGSYGNGYGNGSGSGYESYGSGSSTSSGRKRSSSSGRKKSGGGKSANSAARRRVNRRTRARRKKSRRVYKKRFYVIIILVAVLAIVGAVFGVKAVADLVMNGVSDNVEKVSKTESVTNVDSKTGQATDKNGGKSSTEVSTAVSEDTGIFSVTPSVMIEDDEDDEGNAIEMDLTDDSIAIEKRIRNAVINSKEASILGMYPAKVTEVYGDFSRYEKWGDGLTYHKNFEETMYAVYNGEQNTDGSPEKKSKCIEVSTALKNIMEFDKFTPAGSMWGDVNEDRSGTGWTDYYYSVLIKSDTVMIVYCDKTGEVDGDDHIIIKKYI